MGDGVKTPDYSIDTTLSIMDKTKIDYSIISHLFTRILILVKLAELWN